MPGSDRLLAAFDKQLTELIERWKRQKKKRKKESGAGRGGVEPCPTVSLPGFYMVDLYFNARVCCHMQLCASACACLCLCGCVWVCVFFLPAPVCLRVKWPCFLKKKKKRGMELGWCVFLCFSIYPTFCLSSFLIWGSVMSWAALVAEKGFNKTRAQILNGPQTTRCHSDLALSFKTHAVVCLSVKCTCSNISALWVLQTCSISCNLSAQFCCGLFSSAPSMYNCVYVSYTVNSYWLFLPSADIDATLAWSRHNLCSKWCTQCRSQSFLCACQHLHPFKSCSVSGGILQILETSTNPTHMNYGTIPQITFCDNSESWILFCSLSWHVRQI